MNDLDSMRRDLAKLRYRFLSGEPVKTDMDLLAQSCADLYNEKARDVAKRMGRKPILITADKILRSEIVRR
jgi:hypothetical protein